MSDAVRRTVRYTGHVQGVNFRRSAARVATGYGVTGTVRNEADGSVRLVAEANPETLTRCLEDIEEVMEGHIESAEVQESLATGEFRRFAVIR